MKTAALLLLAALAGAALPAAAAGADETTSGVDTPSVDTPSVKVSGIKDPEMRSYRSIWAGLDAFDEYHAMAPAASLRFQMTHAEGGPADAGDGIALRLASDEGSKPVAIGADGRFTVERERAAYDADATYILNKKNGLFTARPDIRTPGLPENVRRLGDLRLECRVVVAIIKEQIPFLARAAINSLLLTTDWCGKKDIHFSFVGAREVTAATMRSGSREEELEFDGWRYQVPVGATDWPDDTQIELRYASVPAAAAAAAAPAPAP